MPGPALLSSMTQNSTAKGPISTPTPPPGFSSFSTFSSAPSASQSSTPQPPAMKQSAFAPPSSSPSVDPFAALATTSASKPTAPAKAQAAAGADDDEWSFSSALPPEESPHPKNIDVVVHNGAIRIHLVARRPVEDPNSIHATFDFSNTMSEPVSDFHFQIAVTKVNALVFTQGSGATVLLTLYDLLRDSSCS